MKILTIVINGLDTQGRTVSEEDINSITNKILIQLQATIVLSNVPDTNGMKKYISVKTEAGKNQNKEITIVLTPIVEMV